MEIIGKITPDELWDKWRKSPHWEVRDGKLIGRVWDEMRKLGFSSKYKTIISWFIELDQNMA